LADFSFILIFGVLSAYIPTNSSEGKEQQRVGVIVSPVIAFRNALREFLIGVRIGVVDNSRAAVMEGLLILPGGKPHYHPAKKSPDHLPVKYPSRIFHGPDG